MKKYLIVFAAMVFVFASCEQKDKLQGLSFKNTQETLIIGDTLRLALLADPADAELPEDIVWASSDTNVVKVIDTKGNITAVGKGNATVTASYKDLKAACKIEADYYEAFWELDWIYYFPSTEQDVSTEIVTYGDYKCTLKAYEFFCPNKLDFAEDLSSGDGECVFTTAIVPVIAEGEYKGEMLARQFKMINDESEYAAFTAMRGKYNPAVVGAIFQPYFEALDAEESADIDWETYVNEGVTGTIIREAFITDDGGISYYYACDGIVTEGVFVRQVNEAGDAYECVFDFTAEWFGGIWGLGLETNWEAETYSEVLVQPFGYEPGAAYHYTTGQKAKELALSAPRKLIKRAKSSNEKIVRREKPVRVKFAPEAK